MNATFPKTVAEWNKMRLETTLKLLALFYFTDFLTTYILIEYGGWYEGNPIMNYAIEASGTTWGLLFAKLFFFSFFLSFYIFNAEFREKMQKPSMILLMRGITVLYAMVVFYSVYHVTQI